VIQENHSDLNLLLYFSLEFCHNLLCSIYVSHFQYLIIGTRHTHVLLHHREMGPTGPCGPCTEIHYDRIGNRDAALLVNDDRPDCIEIWNNVFIQFNRETDGSLKELPSKHVDTGMGFERLSSILQGKDSNYDTDIFVPIFKAIHANTTDCRPYLGLVGADDTDLKDMAYRVVADHIRTLTFAITDGAVPSSEGRGYVLRRILRRAVRYGQEILTAPSGFFTKLVPVVVDNFSDMFPELLVKKDFVMSVIAEEESSFNRTLDQGVKHFKKVVASMEASGSKVVPAKDAHLLFSSMGFPLDLTELMAAERSLTVDSQGFQDLMDSDRKISEAAEAARKSGGEKDLTMEAEQTAWLATNGVAITDSDGKYDWNSNPTAKVLALFQGRGLSTAGFADEVTEADGSVGVILDVTSFYYESGGQIFDTGSLKMANGDTFEVQNSQTYAGYVVHVGFLQPGSAPLVVGSSVTVNVDYERRSFVAPNHTMTHVLNYALKKVLLDEQKGGSVTTIDQKGSLVDTEKLRFDFTWNGALSAPQVEKIEGIVNDHIKREVAVFAEVVPLADASKICSLRAVFGERYPDPVRVISVGAEIQTLLADPTNPKWHDMSVEFCGGTHLTNSSLAEDFVLVEESGIAKGIRRIVGLTRNEAKRARALAKALLDRLSALEAMPGGSDLLTKSKSIKIEVSRG
jgi:alanyl-tRNA synthetase